MRAALARLPSDPDVAVVLMGSWGRFEVTPGSDSDFVVLVDGPQRHAVAPRPGAVHSLLESPGPAEEGSFGETVFAARIAGAIGLADDSNRNLTLRMLLLLESVALSSPEVHGRVREAILAAYLPAHVKDHRPPRFLLNDVIRYWRTIAVDFEGKLRTAGPQKWGLRSVKLRSSRTVLFASGLLPVLQCHRYRAAEFAPFLAGALARPPADRIADAFVAYDAVDAGARALAAYDELIGRLGDPEVRAELERVGPADADHSTLYGELRGLGNELQAGLLALLFERQPLAGIVRQYGVL